jgi:hypothetical protein
VAVHCPRNLAAESRPADAPGRWAVGAGTRLWLIELRRIGPVIRSLRDTDPLFRQAGMPGRRMRARGVLAAWCGEQGLTAIDLIFRLAMKDLMPSAYAVAAWLSDPGPE